MPGRNKRGTREVAISEFKTKTPFRVTRNGKAVADIFPPTLTTDEKDWIGSMSRGIEITGRHNFTSPVIAIREIED